MSRVEEMEKRCELKHKHWQDFSWAWQPTRIGKKRRLRCVYIICVLWGNLECVEHIMQTSREHVLHCRAISDEIAEEKNVSNSTEILLRMSAQNLRSVRRQSCVGCRILESYSTLYMRYQVLESWTKYVRDFLQRFYCIVSGFLDPVISSSSPRLIVGCSLSFYFLTHHAADSLSSLGCRARSLKQIKIVGSFAVRFSSSENIFMRIQCALFFI